MSTSIQEKAEEVMARPHRRSSSDRHTGGRRVRSRKLKPWVEIDAFFKDVHEARILRDGPPDGQIEKMVQERWGTSNTDDARTRRASATERGMRVDA